MLATGDLVKVVCIEPAVPLAIELQDPLELSDRYPSP